MFIIKLTYVESMDEIDHYLVAHREFLDVYYRQGLFLMSGPMKPRTGGIIIALCNVKVEIDRIMAKDPFIQAGVATYELIEFTPIKHQSQLKDLIEAVEGKLC